MGGGRIRSLLLCAAAISALANAGCGLFKRSNATDAWSAKKMRELAEFLEIPTNLTRSSGEVTYLRLQALFPTAPTGDPNPATWALRPTDFQTLSATGLNRSIAQDARPTTAIAQIGLRKWAAPLCKSYADPTLTTRYSLFSTEGIFLSTETPPSDPVVRLAVAAARNAWLDIFTPDSDEVQMLVKLYRGSLAAGGSDSDARQALCMAVLLAPQFWVGNTGPRDAIRRASLELARRLPDFADYEKLMNHQLTVSDYVRRIQTDPQLQPGYLSAIHSWHEAWWGLRPFLPGGQGIIDPRWSEDYNGGYWGFSDFGGGWANRYSVYPSTVDATVPTGEPLLENTGSYHSNFEYDRTEECDPTLSQDFDPRTTMITKEHRRSDGVWEVVGAFVLNDAAAKSDFLAYMQAYVAYPTDAFTNGSDCVLISSTSTSMGAPDAPVVPGQPTYYKCKGRVSLPTQGFRTVSMVDFDDSFAYIKPGDGTKTYRYFAQHIVQGNTLAENLYGTVHQDFNPGDRRIRRKSPNGWQNGVSPIYTWYTRDKAYACNDLNRYWLTCALRPLINDGSGGLASAGGYGLYWYVNGAFSSGESPEIIVGAGRFTKTLANPMTLNQFRCGVPHPETLPVIHDTSPFPAAVDLVAYPYGYDMANYTSSALTNINSAIIGATNYITTGTENAAMQRLNDDIMNEPYRLLDYVITNGKPYSDLFTADFTLGREELELYYRQQNYLLPAYPPGYTPTAAKDPARLAVRPIKRKSLPQIPLGWFKGPGTGLPGIFQTGKAENYAFNQVAMSSGYIPPLATSGILSMPAFLGPVSQKMRTISSRVFSRLLCGQPNVFQPDSQQKALHKQFMVLPSNPIANASAALHLDETKGCFTCHVNLDPLGAALSGHFLQNVQVDELHAMSGEFLPSAGYNSAAMEAGYYLGARSGGEPGDGAFLGSPVHGIESVAQVLVQSRLLYSCVVQNTFSAVYGRPMSLYDVKATLPLIDAFQKNRDYNQLIRDLISLKAYSEEN